MGLDQAIKRMTPETALKLAKWQESGQNDEYFISDEEYGAIEELWRGRKENHIRAAIEYLSGENAINCGYVFLSKPVVERLTERLAEVSQEHSLAATVLPTQDGFFFGSTQYDEYYFADIERELEAFRTILKEWDESKSYAYWEWW